LKLTTNLFQGVSPYFPYQIDGSASCLIRALCFLTTSCSATP
jgi:hypothetical protein